ncbi:MAG: hypothetical protein ACI9YT_002375 [Halobacteriales archaeon]|jgi:hypothetical protein
MGFRPTRRMVPAFSDIPRPSTIPGCFGESSPSTTGAPLGSTTEQRTTSIESTRPPVGSTETRSPGPTETTTEPPPSTAERTTYPSGADPLTVIGVDGSETTRHRGSSGDYVSDIESALEKVDLP